MEWHATTVRKLTGQEKGQSALTITFRADEQGPARAPLGVKLPLLDIFLVFQSFVWKIWRRECPPHLWVWVSMSDSGSYHVLCIFNGLLLPLFLVVSWHRR